MTRRRPAPSAERIANSRVRTVARARSRLATLAQQISRTKPTTPRNSIEVNRRSRPMTASCIGSRVTPRPLFVFGNSRASRAATAARSASAASSVAPGLKRPIACSTWAPRASGGAPCIETIAQMLLRPISSDSFGTMPTTVYSEPSSRMSRPTTVRSALNRARQNASLKTTTLARRVSSEGRNVRPTIALTPSTSKIPAVTHWRGTVSARPSAPAMTMPPTPATNPPIRSNVRLRWSQSVRFSGETPSLGDGSVRSQIITRRSGSRNGSGRSSVASTSAKIALLAPMPSARVTVATSAKPGERRNCLSANFTSSRSSSSH